MKKMQMVWAGIAIVLAIIFTLQAQNAAIPMRPVIIHAPVSSTDDDLATMIQAVELTTPMAADLVSDGTFWSAQHNQSSAEPWPPFPGDVNHLPAWNLGDNIWLLDDANVDYEAIRVENEAALTVQRLIKGSAGGGIHAMDVPSVPGGGSGGSGGSFSPMISFSTNDLYLQITNVANGLAYLNLMNGTDSVYEIYSTAALVNGSNAWSIAAEVWPTNPAVMPFTVPESNPTNLFIWARDWTGITSLGNTTPEWWFWKYYGTVDLSDTNRDSTGGHTLLVDYEYNEDPNTIQFYFNLPLTPVTSNSVNCTIGIIQGTPFYMAVLINDTNQADAVWQPYSSNIVVSLNSGNGVYNVLIGLRGLPSDATQTWESDHVSFYSVSPSLTITNPTSSAVSVPMIQLQGLVNENLSSLTFDVSNATGIFTNQQGYWKPAFIDTNLLSFTTNSFQCYDIALTTGTNRITLHATDSTGNTTTANVSYTLSYAGVTNPPALSLVWPQPNTAIGSSNFTMQAQVSDATATVTTTINGNTVQGLVERSGAIWFNNLPLNSGTNTVTLTATSAAGNVNTTNFNVVKSSVSLTIDPLPTNELNQASVTVSGTVGGSGESVWVNGMAATVTGGSWSATNVPVSASGTALVMAQAGTATNSIAASMTLNQVQPVTVLLASFSETSYENNPNNSYDTPDWEDTVANWTYDLGGSYVAWGLTPSGSGFWPRFESDDSSGSFSASGLTWEDGVYSGSVGSANWQFSMQSQAMIAPAGQQAAGATSVYLVSASAMTFSDPVEALDFDAGDVPVAPETLAVNGQMLVNSGLTNADGSVSGLTLVSGPAGAPLPLTTTASALPVSYNNQAQTISLRLFGANNGHDFTDETNAAIVGQQIPLVAQLSITNSYMTNFSLANFQWTVPGFAISNYVADGSSGIVYSNFTTTSSNVNFVWVDDGSNRVVQCSATVNGLKITGKTTFNVLKPTATITTHTTSVNVDTFLGYLGFYDPNTFAEGIAFTNTMTIPSGFSGTNEWVQIVLNPYRARLDTNSVWWVFTENGAAPYLDTSYPYTNRFGITANIAYDSPSSPLLNGYSEIIATNSFKMWLMFKPTGGQWVPLRTVTWNWSGTAILSGSNWTLISPSWSTNPPDADAGATFPQWNSNVQNATYQAQP
jgi:hypothetical protein